MASWGVTPPLRERGLEEQSEKATEPERGWGRFGDEQDTQHSPFSFLLPTGVCAPMLPPDAG